MPMPYAREDKTYTTVLQGMCPMREANKMGI